MVTLCHLIFAPDSFVHLLAPLFTPLLCHGYMSSCLGNARLQPIPKARNKDYSCSVNYCGIALASCFSMVIELCIVIWCMNC